jgi:hypothetical protein
MLCWIMLKGYRSVGYGLGLSSPPNAYAGACELYERWLGEREAPTPLERAMARMLRRLAEIESFGEAPPLDDIMEMVADKLEIENQLLGIDPIEPEKWLDEREEAAWRSRLRSLYQASNP